MPPAEHRWEAGTRDARGRDHEESGRPFGKASFEACLDGPFPGSLVYGLRMTVTATGPEARPSAS